jgi:hypothetical protein
MAFWRTGTQAYRTTVQRRTFLGLQRPPPPKPHVMGYLVAQGLGIVLLADLAIATALGQPTTIRSIATSAGFWQDAPPFESAHHPSDKERT